MSPNLTLYAALALYAAGTVVALATLFTREKRPQHIALGMMIAGFIAHTVWIGTICVRTHHPPLTNLPEAAAFTAWLVFAEGRANVEAKWTTRSCASAFSTQTDPRPPASVRR